MVVILATYEIVDKSPKRVDILSLPVMHERSAVSFVDQQAGGRRFAHLAIPASYASSHVKSRAIPRALELVINDIHGSTVRKAVDSLAWLPCIDARCVTNTIPLCRS